MIPSAEFIDEILRWCNRALIDESTTVGVIGIGLEYTMPVLQSKSVIPTTKLGSKRYPYDRGHQVHVRVTQLIHDVERKVVTLTSAASTNSSKKRPERFTLFPVISGPGKTLFTRLALQRRQSAITQTARPASDIPAKVPIGSNVRIGNVEFGSWANGSIDFRQEGGEDDRTKERTHDDDVRDTKEGEKVNLRLGGTY